MKFKQKPKVLTDEEKSEKEKLVQEILAGADRPASDSRKNYTEDQIAQKPWLAFEDDTIKEMNVFSFRIPKEEMLQLKYLNKKTRISINALCLTGIRQYIKKELEELL